MFNCISIPGKPKLYIAMSHVSSAFTARGRATPVFFAEKVKYASKINDV